MAIIVFTGDLAAVSGTHIGGTKVSMHTTIITSYYHSCFTRAPQRQPSPLYLYLQLQLCQQIPNYLGHLYWLHFNLIQRLPQQQKMHGVAINSAHPLPMSLFCGIRSICSYVVTAFAWWSQGNIKSSEAWRCVTRACWCHPFRVDYLPSAATENIPNRHPGGSFVRSGYSCAAQLQVPLQWWIKCSLLVSP